MPCLPLWTNGNSAGLRLRPQQISSERGVLGSFRRNPARGAILSVPDVKAPHCSCPYHEDGGHKCKHIFAVEFVVSRERNADGSTTVTQTRTIRETIQRTYPQNWTAYNAAQTHEKEKFLDLLRDLCAGVDEPVRPKNGRPPLPIQDAIFSACFKVYSTVSGRRFMSDLRDAHAKGFISKLPHFNSIFNYLESPELTPVLRAMITETQPAA